jgi:predicted glycoside hydrolase/deacetylase ChbG (UPF0249 family)
VSAIVTKRLVVTADDAGLHPGMTEGVIAAHTGGIVTAAAVASVGGYFDEAAERLRDHPALDVGIHWVLVGERPLSPAREVPSLLAPSGAFLSSFRAFARRYFLGRVRMAEVEREMRRQLERLLATGLPVVHANGHQHLHVLPRVFEIARRLAEEHAIPWVRIPSEPAASWRSLRGVEIRTLNAFGRAARRQLVRRRTIPACPDAPDVTVGVLDAGRLSFERVVQALVQVRGTAELVCHPGLREADLALAYDWDYGWEGETAALCDPRLPPLLAEMGIELTSFSRLRNRLP